MPSFSETLQTVGWLSSLFVVSSFILGACVGSFLNVVIYRLPRNLSVNKPARSFCPKCKKDIPGYRNIPLVTWLVQRGKCAECGCSISVRYFIVELLTGLLFLAVWLQFSSKDPLLALFFMILMALLVVVIFVDAELMVIPLQVTCFGVILGLIGGTLIQHHLRAEGWLDGFLASLKGMVVGAGSFWLIVRLGKLLFGKQVLEYQEAVNWHLREPDEEDLDNPMDLSQELCFVIDGEPHGWSDLFFRPNDQLILEGSNFRVDGKKIKANELSIKHDQIEAAGKTYTIAEIDSLEGKASRVVIPREAMGMGDVHLMGMLGACLGMPALLFIVSVACVFSLLLALLGRVGFGRPLPFGPSLALGGIAWVFSGWWVWDWYFALMKL